MQPQVPFGFAQGRLSTPSAAADYAQDDSFTVDLIILDRITNMIG